jgi:hypothetical protein
MQPFLAWENKKPGRPGFIKEHFIDLFEKIDTGAVDAGE